MKKMNLLIAGLSLCLCFSAQSQISGGAQLSYFNFLGYTSSPGFGIKGFYEQSDKIMAYGAVNFYPGGKMEGTSSVQSKDGFGLKEIDATSKFKIFNIQVGARYYFVGGTEETFGVYGGAAASFIGATAKTEYEQHGDDAFVEREDEKEFISGFGLSAHLGAEYNIGFGSVFFDASVGLPANQANGEAVSVSFGAFAQIDAGIRIPLNF
ncbi:MAG: hypothetical protein ACI9XP_001014 [Lentimonas sp.]|jgi:hypothetical protein